LIDRRLFLAGLGMIGATPAFRLDAKDVPVSDVAALARSFPHPPDSARPWVIWFWVNGNVTRKGITADLEAMQRVGLGGVQIMDVDPGVPAGPAQFGSDAWLDMLDFALSEATRLGLVVEMNDDDGWTGSAGPWITPELSMQKVVWSEVAAEGGTMLDLPLPQPETLLGWYRDITVLAFPTPDNDDVRLPDIAFKAGYKAEDHAHMVDAGMPPLPSDLLPVPPDAYIAPSSIIDISAHLATGRLRWRAPAGRWTIMRIGHTTTARDNHPVSPRGQGLECDKLSKAAIKAHMDGFIGKLARRDSRFVGKTFLSTHIDSWEIGDQNWTALFPAEFLARRGYSILPWLPALSGRIIGDTLQTERFLWDVRQTIGDLVVENYAAEARRLAHEIGLTLSIEGYDADPTNQILYGAQADVPQAEFWYGRDFFPEVHRSYNWTTAMTSAAHVYGKRVAAAEAFTAMPDERWLAHPATMKPLGDWALSAGVNHFIFHRFAMQPWLDHAPGMTMGAWGTHYERTQTWWELSGPWHLYLTRCQHLLRQGLPVADLLYLTPEGAPMRFTPPDVDIRSAEPPATPAYPLDGCPPDALFSRVAIVDGLIALPDGKRYHALILPDAAGGMQGAGMMTPRLLARIAALVEQGMTVIGPPPRHSPSLENYPACDEQVRALVISLWGSVEPTAPVDRRIGRGRVMSGLPPSEALASMGVVPDFDSGLSRPFRSIHRRLADGSDLYFVANGLGRAITACCAFRASGRPEIWHPERGDVTYPALHDELDGRAYLPLALDPHEAVFIVFPARSRSSPSIHMTAILSDDSATPVSALHSEGSGLVAWIDRGGTLQWRAADEHVHNTPFAAPPLPISPAGKWKVEFGVNTSMAKDPLSFPGLTSWSEHADPAIRYFSGTATYRNEIIVPKGCLGEDVAPILDLGRVENFARVRINGREAGILWKPPFTISTADLLREGANSIELEIVNLWPNRLIGDEQLPADAEWETADFGGVSGFGERLARWPEWLVDGQRSPTGRSAFATWKLWTSKDKLLPSGLLGPVSLRFRRKIALR
jgi:hypothetical protein